MTGPAVRLFEALLESEPRLLSTSVICDQTGVPKERAVPILLRARERGDVIGIPYGYNGEHVWRLSSARLP